MATLANLVEKLPEWLGVSEGTVRHVWRRAGEAGLLPRGPRGRGTPHVGAGEAAALLVAVMCAADGLVPAVQVAEPVRRLRDGTTDKGGSFIDYIAELIDGRREPGIEAVGLTFSPAAPLPWIERRDGKNTQRVDLIVGGAQTASGMAREVRVAAPVLEQIRKLLANRPEPRTPPARSEARAGAKARNGPVSASKETEK